MLVIGPPGSGKTTQALQQLRSAITETRPCDTSLVVPTASMAQHLAHRLAREGLTVPADAVLTLDDLVQRLTPKAEPVTAAREAWIVKRALAEIDPEPFREVASTAGLRSKVVASIQELEGAGTRPEELGKALRSPAQRALNQVFAAYRRRLEELGLVSGPERLRLAAETVLEGGTGLHRLIFDGFLEPSRAERLLLESLRRSGLDVTVYLPFEPEAGFADWPREQVKEVRRPHPPPIYSESADLHGEVVEVARAVAEEVRGGRAFHDIGVVLRTPEPYAGPIQRVFEDFGIPYRFRRPRPLRSHPAAAVPLGVLRAAIQGFPADRTLDALRRNGTPFASRPGADWWDFRIREKLPAEGLAILKDHAPRSLAGRLERLETFAQRLTAKRSKEGWARAVSRLADDLLEGPPAPDGLSPERVLELRAWGRARQALDEALEQAAGLIESPGFIDLPPFLEAFEFAVDFQTIRTPDARRNVVNVLSVFEARQWELPVVFLCGLAEGRFPVRPTEDFFFPDADRRALRPLGVELRTLADREREERRLYDIAVSRASEKLTVSRPQIDEAGAPLTRSFFLPKPESIAVARPAFVRRDPLDYERPEAALGEDLLPAIRQRFQSFSPSAIERFLQCPYQLFAGGTLSLKGAPEEPEQRFDPRSRGSVVHDVVDAWSKQSERAIAEVFEEIFDQSLAANHIPPSFHTELLRAALRTDLERFALEPWAKPLGGGESEGLEKKVEFLLDDDTEIGGRIDRFDLVDGRYAVVVDYKYSSANRFDDLIKEYEDPGGKSIQILLYLAGLGRGNYQLGGALLWSLRGKTSVGGWLSTPVYQRCQVPADNKTTREEPPAALADRVRQAEQRAAAAIARIRAGDIQVEPLDRSFCSRLCDFRGVCRVDESPHLA